MLEGLEESERKLMQEEVIAMGWTKSPGLSLDDVMNLRYIGDVTIASSDDYEYFSNAVSNLKMKFGPMLFVNSLANTLPTL